ncbi:MAG: PVC-type heme-binding CxxCH protein, partial [Planctomycetota bacterium]
MLPLLLAAGVCATVLLAAEQLSEEDKKRGVYEVQVDGYVEKIDPNVDYKDRLPRIPPREPAESMKGFHMIPGFRLEQVAAEPMIRDSVDVAFDENGRLYVVELTTYAENNSAQFSSTGARISLLEDTDNDGKFDTSTVFVDKLMCPTAVTCFDGGVFVAAAPDVLYCKDTDGDGKADLREVVVTGFGMSANALPNSLRWGLDNRIHGMSSTTGGEIRAVRWERGGEGRKAEPVQSRGRDFSFHPRTGELRLESGGAQYGMSFDEWGRKFECSNSAPIYMIMYEDRYIARNPYYAAPSPRVAIWKDGTTVYRKSPVEPWRILRTELRLKGTFTGPIEGGGTPAG